MESELLLASEPAVEIRPGVFRPASAAARQALSLGGIPKTSSGDACGENSLLPLENSLIIKIFSLLICAGNFSESRCRTAVSR